LDVVLDPAAFGAGEIYVARGKPHCGKREDGKRREFYDLPFGVSESGDDEELPVEKRKDCKEGESYGSACPEVKAGKLCRPHEEPCKSAEGVAQDQVVTHPAEGTFSCRWSAAV